MTCTIAEGAVFTQMMVGVYQAETERLVGVAMGLYAGSTNTIPVTFGFDLPDSYTLKVFCVDNSFAPQYAVGEFLSES